MSSGRGVDYYGLRRLNPYLGLIQVIDLGPTRAYSDDGENWRVRRVFDSEVHWQHYDTVTEVSRQAIEAAIEDHPPIPFPLGDRYELWLLASRDRTPLALMRSCRWPEEMDEVSHWQWNGFTHSACGFHPVGHDADAQKRLQQMVTWAALPEPALQWFERRADGSGVGLGGLRVEAESGRVLAAESFPELLITEAWEGEAERALARHYHDWYAARLLAHPGLCDDTRARLEHALIHNPLPLLESYRLIPTFLEPERVRVAMVAARLLKSAQ